MSVDINERDFFLVEASRLSFDDTFMKHEPCDEFERKLKNDLCYVISSKMKDFYCSRNAPLLSEVSDEIIAFENDDVRYHESYRFWNKVSKKLNKEKKSRIGTRYQYSAYLGTVIKQLVSCGITVEQAWKEVHYLSKLYDLSKENPQYQGINISFYGIKDVLLRDDIGIIGRIQSIVRTGIFKKGYYFFHDEPNGYYNLYKYWFGTSDCVPWIVCDA